MCFKFAKNMKRFVLILVFCSGLLFQTGLSAKIESQEQLLQEKEFNLDNEAYNQEYHVFEDPLLNNADLTLKENPIDETRNLQLDIIADSVTEEGIHPPQRASCKCENGDCVVEDGKRICTCLPGFGNYSITKCKACECGPDTDCIFTTSYSTKSKVCLCNTGYAEQDGKCVGPCYSNPCKNNGTCEVKGLSFKCKCESPYSGDICEKGSLCDKNPCQNGGKCTVNMDGKGITCNCVGKWKGKTCSENPCSPSPCGNGGKCKINGKSFTCDCPDNFVGETCQYDCTCKNGKCRVTSDDKVLCECLPEYGKKSDDCIACDCGTGANCTWESGWFSDTKYCLCPDGSKLEEKHCEDPCNSNPCSNNGKCKVYEKTFKCECKPPYIGLTCKDDLCTKNPCQNGATCQINGTSFQCNCKAPYSGTLCEKDLCTTNPCQNGGICVLQETSFLCYCRNPYFGKLCERTTETSSPEITTDSSSGTSTTSVTETSSPEITIDSSSGTSTTSATETSSPEITTDSYSGTSTTSVTETSSPEITTDSSSGTSPTPHTCNDDVCVHGKCEIAGRYYRCRCFEGFTGLRCEDKIQNKSDKPTFWQILQISIMCFCLILLFGVFCILLRRKKRNF